VLTVYSSADVLAQRNNTYTESFLVRHVVLMMGAVVVMYIAHMVNYMQYARWSTVLIAIAIPMLIYTMFFGVNINSFNLCHLTYSKVLLNRLLSFPNRNNSK